MKKAILALILILTLLFCGCSIVKTGILDPSEISVDDSSSYASMSGFSGWVMDVANSRILLSSLSNPKELLWFTAEDIPVTNVSGDPINYSDIHPGNTLEITYSGQKLKTYPETLSKIHNIHVTGSKATLVPFYLNVLEELFDIPSGIDDDVKLIAFDLNEATNLTPTEKNALMFICGNRCGRDVIHASYSDLKQMGQLSSDDLTFTDGMLITIYVAETARDNGFEFGIQIWRSAKNAVGFSECIATIDNGTWSYEPGSAWES